MDDELENRMKISIENLNRIASGIFDLKWMWACIHSYSEWKKFSWKSKERMRHW